MKVKSWKRSFCLPVALLLMGITLLLSVSPVVQAAEYMTLYPLAHLEVDDCLKLPCDGYIRHITRFVDSAVLRGDVQPPDEVILPLVLQATSSDGVGYISTFPNDFRLFIPPGTTKVIISMFLAESDAKLVLRYKSPPTCSAYYSSEDIDWETSTDLDEMDQDVYLSYHNLYVSDTFRPSVEESGWLYIKKLAGTMDSITVSITVDPAEFMVWYNDLEVIWDGNGDPWSENNGVASIEVCGSDNLDACQESNCQTDGKGYWYNDELGGDEYCHAMPPACDETDFYWYEDECHEEPEQGVCSEDNLYACSTEAECVDAGGEWYIKSACVEKGSSTYTPYTPPGVIIHEYKYFDGKRNELV